MLQGVKIDYDITHSYIIDRQIMDITCTFYPFHNIPSGLCNVLVRRIAVITNPSRKRPGQSIQRYRRISLQLIGMNFNYYPNKTFLFRRRYNDKQSSHFFGLFHQPPFVSAIVILIVRFMHMRTFRSISRLRIAANFYFQYLQRCTILWLKLERSRPLLSLFNIL